MKLSNYIPAGNKILLELKEYHQSSTGIFLTTPQSEKVMKVLKVGPLVSIINPWTSEKVKEGDFVIMDGNPMPQFTFEEEEKGKGKVITVQGTEYAVMSFYRPSADETKFFIVAGEETTPEFEDRKMTIIDNPGIEKSPYLKEEKANAEALKGNSKIITP